VKHLSSVSDWQPFNIFCNVGTFLVELEKDAIRTFNFTTSLTCTTKLF